MSTDTTQDWGVYFERDWGEAGDNRYFCKFWRNVVLWLAENSGGTNRRLRVETDKVIYRAGEPMRVSARAFDDKLEETHAYRLVLRLHPAGRAGAAPPAALQELTLDGSGAEGAYEGVLTAPPPTQLVAAGGNPLAALQVGALDVLAYDKDRLVAQATLNVQVLDDPVEFQDPQPDADRLARIAHESGGQVLHSADDLARLRGSYGSTPGEVVVRKAPLWDHAALWALLLGLLAADWVLRRSWGLA
jgi:hypothetical protein